MNSFFPYYCAQTDAPFCERVQLMNLALGYEDAQYALPVLAQLQGAEPQVLAARLIQYIMSRDCFKKPWLAVDATQCPKRALGECCCQQSPD